MERTIDQQSSRWQKLFDMSWQRPPANSISLAQRVQLWWQHISCQHAFSAAEQGSLAVFTSFIDQLGTCHYFLHSVPMRPFFLFFCSVLSLFFFFIEMVIRTWLPDGETTNHMGSFNLSQLEFEKMETPVCLQSYHP